MRRYWKSFLRWVRKQRDNLLDVGEDMWEDIEPALENIVEAGGKKLLQLAYEAVVIAENPDKSGEEKFREAKKHVLNGIKDEIDSALDQTINLAIEIGVARLKRSIGENT
jgi:hypothetical protein